MAAGNSLCRCVIAGHLELSGAQAIFVRLVIRAARFLEEPYDLNAADSWFIYRLNELTTEIDAIRGLIQAFAAKAIAASTDPKNILAKAIEEAKGHLTGPEVRELLREEWRRAKATQEAQ